jgi:hypothetical protein
MSENMHPSTGGAATSGGTGMYPAGETQAVRDAYDAQQAAKK